MNNPSSIKKSQQIFLLFIGLAEHFWSWGIGSFPLCSFPLRFRVLLIDPCYLSFDDTDQNVILPLQNVLANCDSSLFLFFGEPLWDHFCTHLPLVKIPSYDFPNCFPVDVLLFWYAPDSQPTIFTHNLTNFCNIFFSSSCCWSSWYSSSVKISLPP